MKDSLGFWLQSAASLVPWVLSFYSLGFVVLRLWGREQTSSTPLALLERLWVGVLVAVGGFALVRSGGNTICLLLIVPALGALWIRRISPPSAAVASLSWWGPIKANGLPLLVFLLGATLIGSMGTREWLTGDFRYPSYDPFYPKLTTWVLTFDTENQLVDWTGLVGRGATPYHYFENWTGALMSPTSPGTAVALMSGQVYPLFHLAILLGYAALLEPLLTGRGRWALYAAAALFPLILSVQDLRPEWTMNTFGYNLKMAPMLPSVVWGVLLLRQGDALKASLAFVVLICAYLPVAPAMLGGWFLYLLWYGWRRKLPARLVRPALLSVVVAGVAVSLFYLLQPKVANPYTDSASSPMTYYSTPQALRSGLAILAGCAFWVVVNLLAWGLLLIDDQVRGALRMGWRDLLTLGVLQLVGGAIFWAMAHLLLDSNQLFSNAAVGVFTVMGTLLLALAIWKGRWLTRILGLGFVALLVVLQTRYLRETSAYRIDAMSAQQLGRIYHAHSHNGKCAVWLPQYALGSDVPYWKNLTVGRPCIHTDFVTDQLFSQVVNIEHYRIDRSNPLSTYRDVFLLGRSAFHRYLLENGLPHQEGPPYWQARRDFLTNYQVDVLMIAEGEWPDSLLQKDFSLSGYCPMDSTSFWHRSPQTH